MKIGVLAVQGAFIEHINVLRRLKAEAAEIRLPRDLGGIDGLIIPGGESTTISKLMREFQLTPEILRRAKSGMPIMGTCAGLILLAASVTDKTIEPLGLMDMTVDRNAFGRQVDSFEADVPINGLGGKPYHCVFIRAPVIASVGLKVRCLGKLNGGTCVAARQGNFLAFAFHPELTEDLRIHKYFLDVVEKSKS